VFFLFPQAIEVSREDPEVGTLKPNESRFADIEKGGLESQPKVTPDRGRCR
jgi:hypothetical protein